MNDLELCKAIAEIEGVICYPDHDDGVNLLVTDDLDPYNPLTDKALLWDLMVKYCVQIDPRAGNVFILWDKTNAYKSRVSFKYMQDIPHAVLEVVIKAHADGK